MCAMIWYSTGSTIFGEREVMMRIELIPILILRPNELLHLDLHSMVIEDNA